MNGSSAMSQAVTVTGNAAWARALELWLGSRRSEHTRRAYAGALQDLLASSGRAVYEVDRAGVAAWAEGMRRRGLAEATVQLRVSGVSSFFRYALEECELEGRNPAGGASLRRKVEPYGKATWLSTDEARGLLGAIERESVRGKRDYALVVGYLLLARRNSEWRCVRWGDLERAGAKWQYRWSGKGKKDQRADLPKPVALAVVDYLRADGRGRLAPEDFIFEGQRGRPIDAGTVRGVVKRYSVRAGLDVERVKVHTLRHTAAMLRKEAGDGLEEIMGLLVHSSLAITQIYLHSLEGRKDESWGTVAGMLGI